MPALGAVVVTERSGVVAEDEIAMFVAKCDPCGKVSGVEVASRVLLLGHHAVVGDCDDYCHAPPISVCILFDLVWLRFCLLYMIG